MNGKVESADAVTPDGILYGPNGSKDPAKQERERRRVDKEAAKARRHERLQARKPEIIDNCKAVAQVRQTVEELTEKAEELSEDLELYAEKAWRALPEAKRDKQCQRASHRCEVQFDRYDPNTETLYFDWFYNYDQEYEGYFWITLDQLVAAPKNIRDDYSGR